MAKESPDITVFEHDAIRIDKGEKRLTETQLKALQSYYDKAGGVPYFSLEYKGIRFDKYVGVLQVGKTLIEVLPKADTDKDKDEDKEDTWRKILVGMIKSVYGFEVSSTSNANLKIKPNTILHLYFELFIKEIEYLLHTGLIKKYRKTEGNNNALKGNLLFAKHIQRNITHQERFYTRYTTYDAEHSIHKILYKTILLLKQINTDRDLDSRLGSLILNFPEMPVIQVSQATFDKLVLNRKSLVYKKGLGFAKMILLQYHPDISKGKNDVLALMFDMNDLWEKFIYASLNKNKKATYKIIPQAYKDFWKPGEKRAKKRQMNPDIIIRNGANEFIVIDTKWKNLNTHSVSSEDLRQLYVYHEFFKAKKVGLVYPGEAMLKTGFYYTPDGKLSSKECAIISIPVKNDIKVWQKLIHEKIYEWEKADTGNRNGKK